MSTINYVSLVTGTLGFTLALAWNGAVSKNLERFFDRRDPKSQARAAIVYAVLITIFVVVLVTAVNYTRKTVYKWKNGAARVPDEKMRGALPAARGAPPAARGAGLARPACSECTHCTTGVVKFWDPVSI